MNQAPTTTEARQSLNDHVAGKGAEIHAKYGPIIGWNEIERILQDPEVVRYPCTIAFSTDGLEEGEFAYAHPLGETPEEGFVIRVHPLYVTCLSKVPHLVLYHLVAVNYGEFASIDDAETFGSAALGMDKEDYYHAVCQLADQLQGYG